MWIVFIREVHDQNPLFHVELFNPKKVSRKANPLFGAGRSKANLRDGWVVHEPDQDLEGVPTTIE